MATTTPIPAPSISVRGQIQKTFVPAKVLTGFMDDQGVQQILGEYLENLDAAERDALKSKILKSQSHVKSLAQVALDDAFIEPLSHPHVEALTQDQIFRQAFAQQAVQFAMVRPEKLVALQVHVKPRADVPPSDNNEFLKFMLPNHWDIPAELSFVPPLGPIHILSSNPVLQGIKLELDAKAGKVLMSPPQHINLVQVVSLGGRYYLRNGYHRVFDCLASGVTSIPALIIPGIQPNDLQIGGNGFTATYVMTMPRPPLVADFMTDAAVDAQFRERRYGVSITLQASPFNIGI